MILYSVVKNILLLLLLLICDRLCSINSEIDINEIYINQTYFKTNDDEVSTHRKLMIKESMKRIWNNYYQNGFGKDEFRPITNDGIDN